MTYHVLAQLKLEKETPPNDTYSFDTLDKALDFYREAMKNMSEDISDFGGEFVITLYSEDGKNKTLHKRNAIITTLNELDYA